MKTIEFERFSQELFQSIPPFPLSLRQMQTRHSSVQRSSQTFIVTMKVEPDTDADRRLLIQAFDQEQNSLNALLQLHIAAYVASTFPGMKVVSADHERYPTLLRVTLKPLSRLAEEAV